MKRTVTITILLLLIIVMTSGCWSNVELKDVAIVAGMATDLKGKSQFEVTMQTIIPGEVKKDKLGAVRVKSSTGFTVIEASRNLINKGGRKQSWHHINAYIMSEELAKFGVSYVIDFLSRNEEPRDRMNVFISKGKAKDILNIKSKIDPIPSAAIDAEFGTVLLRNNNHHTW